MRSGKRTAEARWSVPFADLPDFRGFRLLQARRKTYYIGDGMILSTGTMRGFPGVANTLGFDFGCRCRVRQVSVGAAEGKKH